MPREPLRCPVCLAECRTNAGLDWCIAAHVKDAKRTRATGTRPDGNLNTWGAYVT